MSGLQIYIYKADYTKIDQTGNQYLIEQSTAKIFLPLIFNKISYVIGVNSSVIWNCQQLMYQINYHPKVYNANQTKHHTHLWDELNPSSVTVASDGCKTVTEGTSPSDQNSAVV